MRCLFLLVSYALLPLGLPSPVQNNNDIDQPGEVKSGPSLEGKIFYIKSHEVNQPNSEMNDTLRFNNGKLMSSVYMPYGFKPAAYHASNQHGKIYFTSTCFSDNEGKISWNGVIDGKEISGKYQWHREDQNDINYVFTGIQK